MDNNTYEIIGRAFVLFVVFAVIGLVIWLITMGTILIISKIEKRNEIKNKAKAKKMIQDIDPETVDNITIEKLSKILNKFTLYVYDCYSCDYSSEYNGLCTKEKVQENECRKQNAFYCLKEQIKKAMDGKILIKEIEFERLKKLI